MITGVYVVQSSAKEWTLGCVYLLRGQDTVLRNLGLVVSRNSAECKFSCNKVHGRQRDDPENKRWDRGEEERKIEVAGFPENRNCEPRFLRNWAPYPSGMFLPKQELWTVIPQELYHL